MLGRKSNKLSKPGTTVPFGNLLAILQAMVKNKDRATSNMSTIKITMIRFGLGKHFQKG
jgi:hypothetical protein